MSTIVDTSSGKVQGRARRGVELYAGIPYAAPPTGPDRFRPPRPHPGWSGVRDATELGPAAPQRAGMMELLAGQTEGPSWDEDCLFLNVVTPRADDARRPVLVWIHGGSFTGGSGGVPWYDGSAFAADGDCVVVTLNYRLGALGFLHLGDHLPDLPGTGNLGILDQLAALRWVQDNIERFGGDPANVTVFGESAGAMSVATLLGLPESRGLFHRAIAQSGAAHHVQEADSAAELTDRLLAELALTDPAGLLEVPADRLLAAQATVGDALSSARARSQGLTLPYCPVVDGQVIHRQPLETIAAGEGAGVPLLTGTNLDEWNVWALFLSRTIDEDKLRERIARLLPDNADEAHAAYRHRRPEADPIDVWNAVVTDHIFRIPAIRLAEAVVAGGQTAHVYRFDWPSAAFEGRLGACHALEIPFVFHTTDRPGVDAFLGGPPPDGLADALHTRWTDYARTGTPDGPHWAPYDLDRRPTLILDGHGVEVEDDPHQAERLAWAGRP